MWLADSNNNGQAMMLRMQLGTVKRMCLQPTLFHGELPRTGEAIVVAEGLVQHVDRLSGLSNTSGEEIIDGEWTFWTRTSQGFLTPYVGRYIKVIWQNNDLVVELVSDA